MSKSKKLTLSMLPTPTPVLDHHGQTLFGPMKEWSTQNRIPPVLLLTGASGVGKRSIAYFISQWVMCETSSPAKPSASSQDLFSAMATITHKSSREFSIPCGKCRSCQNAVAGSWVDFMEILPEGDDPSDPLKIERFRKLKESLGFSAHEGTYRIVLIPNAEQMTPQAANSVLKILEEPPPGWIFLLTTSDPTLLLPTLVSRCQFLRLKPFPSKTLKEILLTSGVAPARAEVCARLAEGSWGKALALASDEAWEKRNTVFSFIENPESQMNAIVDWAAADEIHLTQLIDQLESIVSDLIKWSTSAESASFYSWNHSDGKAALNRHVESAIKKLGGVAQAREFWINRADRLGAARRQIRIPLNRKLLVQDLLLPWVGSR
ncbi:MAG: hypothetical protein AABZ55_06535 [Bdellovibrionota bacterium]